MAERDDEWVTEDVEVSKPVGTVVSVRLHPEMAEALFAEAKRLDAPVSAIVRDAVEARLSHEGVKPATFDLTISSLGGPVALYAGRSAYGRTASTPAKLDLVPSEDV
jgi:hypothetical protein